LRSTPDHPKAPRPPVALHRQCPVCSRWYPLTSDGRIAVHDSAYGECAGSRESRDLTAKVAAIASNAKAPAADVLAAARGDCSGLDSCRWTDEPQSLRTSCAIGWPRTGPRSIKSTSTRRWPSRRRTGTLAGTTLAAYPGCRTGLSGPSPGCPRRGVIPGRSVRWCWRIYGLIDDLPDL
jgi:hypothetical protein